MDKLLVGTETDKTTKVAWDHWLISVHPFIHDILWRRYVAASYKLVNEFLEQSEGITNAQSQTNQGQGQAQVIGRMYGNQAQSVLGQQPHSMQPNLGVYVQQPHTYRQHQGQPQWTMPFVPQQHISIGTQGQQLTMMHPVQQTPPSFRAVMDMTGF